MTLIVLLKITHSSASRVRDVRCDPGAPAWSCVSALLLQLHRRIYSTLPSPSIAFPCPAPDLAHSFFIIGKSARAEEAGARKSRSAGSDLWAFFFFEKPQKLKMVPINRGREKKVLGLTFILPPPVFILPFLAPARFLGNLNQIQDTFFDLVTWRKWAVTLAKAQQELIMHGWKTAGGFFRGGENNQAKLID